MAGGKQPGRLRRFAGALAALGFALAIPAGALWALSPLGVRLSEYGFKTSSVFWKLFPSAPLLMVLALVSVYLFRLKDRGGTETVGFYAAVAGGLLVVLGDVGLYHLGLDTIFIMSAPSWRAFRLGLVLLTAGTLVFAFGAARGRSLPVWSALPLAVASLAGLISVLHDYGREGEAMWIGFGAGWVWLGITLSVQGLLSRFGKKKSENASSSGVMTAPDFSTTKHKS